LKSNARKELAERGFLVVGDLFESGELDEVKLLLDPLFERFHSLPARHALDLAPNSGGSARIPDLNRALRVEPRLRGTRVYHRARSLATRLLGAPVFCTFDHAIYKAGGKAAATPMHQDQAYTGNPRAPTAVHIWIPLQDATAENGCMWFVPGSHRLGLVPHHRVEGTTATLVASAADEQTALCCPVAKGGCTVHTPHTLHLAGPNNTGTARKAWIVHFARFGSLSHLHPENLGSRLGRLIGRRSSHTHGWFRPWM
jgi:hypothetical protein